MSMNKARYAISIMNTDLKLSGWDYTDKYNMTGKYPVFSQREYFTWADIEVVNAIVRDYGSKSLIMVVEIK
jgi:Zn-dependent peptidase ImmA (M78 family)